MSRPPLLHRLLRPREHAAALALVRRVRREVPAVLWRALLFGSRARGEGRPDSDVDLLLVFRRLPPDREPQAELAERLAERVAAASGVPLTVWCVSLPDLRRGRRTPMLVDALHDGVPLWPPGAPRLRLAWTPEDARFCAGCLLQRVDEGGAEVAAALRAGCHQAAARRVRDDLVRLCTAALLLRGHTRPRRAEAVLRFLRHERAPPGLAAQLGWAARSFGPRGRDEGVALSPPPGGLAAATDAVEQLRREIARRLAAAHAAARACPPARVLLA